MSIWQWVTIAIEVLDAAVIIGLLWERRAIRRKLKESENVARARKFHIDGMTHELEGLKGRANWEQQKADIQLEHRKQRIAEHEQTIALLHEQLQTCWEARQTAKDQYDESLTTVMNDMARHRKNWKTQERNAWAAADHWRRKMFAALRQITLERKNIDNRIADELQALAERGACFKFDLYVKHSLPPNWAVYFQGEPELERKLQPIVVSLGHTWTRRHGWYCYDGKHWYINGSMIPGNWRPYVLTTAQFLKAFPAGEFKPERGQLVQVRQHESGSWLLKCYVKALNKKNGFVHRCHDGHTYRYIRAIEGLEDAQVSPLPTPDVKLALGAQGNVLAIVQAVGKPVIGYNVVGKLPLGFALNMKLNNGQPAIIPPHRPSFADAGTFAKGVNAACGMQPRPEQAVKVAEGATSIHTDQGVSLHGLNPIEHAKCSELVAVMREAEERGRVVMVLIATPGEVDAINAYATLLRNQSAQG